MSESNIQTLTEITNPFIPELVEFHKVIKNFPFHKMQSFRTYDLPSWKYQSRSWRKDEARSKGKEAWWFRQHSDLKDYFTVLHRAKSRDTYPRKNPQCSRRNTECSWHQSKYTVSNNQRFRDLYVNGKTMKCKFTNDLMLSCKETIHDFPISRFM